MVEAPAGAAEHQNPLRLEPKGSRERELEITRVLPGWATLDVFDARESLT